MRIILLAAHFVQVDVEEVVFLVAQSLRVFADDSLMDAIQMQIAGAWSELAKILYKPRYILGSG